MAHQIADLFEHAVDAVPDRVALICGQRRLTFAEADAEANRLAQALLARGVGRDDHVGVLAKNGIDHVLALIAAYKISAVPINLNYRYAVPELAYVLSDADLVALFYEEEYAANVAAVLPDRPEVRTVVQMDGSVPHPDVPGAQSWAALTAGAPDDRPDHGRTPDDTYILYTGGTTGYPKGVMWRHEDIWRTLGGGIDFLTGSPLDEYDQSEQARTNVAMVAFPLSPLMHGAAQWGSMLHLFGGHCILLSPTFERDEIWRLIDEHQVNVVFMTGDAMARPLIDAYEDGQHSGSSLIAVASSAALFSRTIKQRWMEAFPGTIITDSIGSSETGFSGIGVLDGANIQGEGPVVQMGPEAVVFDDDLNLLDPDTDIGAVGRSGRSGHVPVGYYKDPVKSAATFFVRDGVRYAVPGDYVRIEAGRRLTLLGRGSNCINTGGEKVYPEEVEVALKSHPDVYDCLVVGIPDDRWGQHVSALVQPRRGATPDLESLRTHARTIIAAYKLPRSATLVDEIPRHITGKADYPRARELLIAEEGLGDHAHAGFNTGAGR